MCSDYTNMAMRLDGVVFYHPADGSEAAVAAHNSADGMPYIHLYGGDTIGDLLQWMEEQNMED